MFFKIKKGINYNALFLLIIIPFLFSHKYSNKIENKSFVIQMHHDSNDSIYIECNYINYNLSLLDSLPDVKEEIIKKYTGIPNHDSILYYANYEDNVQYLYDLYKLGKYKKESFLKFVKQRDIDTLSLSKKQVIQGYVSVVGFYKNKQFIVADLNRNKNFSDDFKYEFDINFRKKALDSICKIRKLLYSNYSYESNYNNHIQTYNRKLIFYPSIYGSIPDVSKKAIQYTSKWNYIDYWKGEKIINNKCYEFYYQSRDNVFGSLYVKPKEIKFSSTDDTFNNQFMHYSSDVFAIENIHIRLDSINRDISKLYITEINNNINKYGNAIGNYLKTFKFNTLNGKPFKINDISSTKKYTLIEFWGTWCEPCVKMTTQLKKIKTNFASKLNIISIANDESVHKVKKYVTKNKMNWTNGFIDINKESPILNELRIGEFPTFILIDSNHKILYRGGSDSFNTIYKLIK